MNYTALIASVDTIDTLAGRERRSIGRRDDRTLWVRRTGKAPLKRVFAS
jgi:hypothetical protein